MSTHNLRFAIFGTGFWARFQLAAWRELEGALCVAFYNRTKSKAEKLAQEFGVPRVYDDAEELLKNEHLDFVDIITDVDTHPRFVELAAKYKVPVICQKPMAPDLETARRMVQTCRDANVPFFIHENWRWQTPIQELKRVLESGVIGEVFRARIDMISGFPVFVNQPFFKDLEEFIIADLGSHTLDVARFLFGEAHNVYCQTQQVHKDIKGEDAATIMLQMQSGPTVVVEMAYAENYLERDRFPETVIFVEGSEGSVLLDFDYWIRITTKNGTLARRVPPPRYAWADPAYDIVHSSIVPCNRDILGALRGEHLAQTSADDNLKTVELVFASYQSARENAVQNLG
jgi:D-apiose dehydrogenase